MSPLHSKRETMATTTIIDRLSSSLEVSSNFLSLENGNKVVSFSLTGPAWLIPLLRSKTNVLKGCPLGY